MGRTGDIKRMLTHSFEWNIPEFFSHSQEEGMVYDSPDFEFASETWSLMLIPKVVEYSGEWTSVFLESEDYQSEKLVTYKLSLIDKDGKEYIHYTFKDKICNILGTSRFVKRSQLLKDREQIAPNGILTISCTLSYEDCAVNTERRTSLPSHIEKCTDKNGEIKKEDNKKAFHISKGVDKVTQDLKKLFLSEEDSDVTLKVKDRLFPAHRLILKARSPVFRSMFQHNTAEKTTGIVDITDCNPDAFHDFLLCLYSGNAEKMSTSNALSLYSIADKYGVDEIKTGCVEFMERELSVDTVCDVIALTLLHNDLTLIESSTSFFTRNVKEIILTVNWQAFLTENPIAANGLYIKALNNLVPK